MAWELKSPTGRFLITLYEREVFNTHWVHTPTLSDTRNGEALIAFDEQWSLDASAWRDDSVVALTLRKYPGDHVPADLVVDIDCLAKTATLGDIRIESLDRVQARLDAALSYPNRAAPAEVRELTVLEAIQRILRRIGL